MAGVGEIILREEQASEVSETFLEVTRKRSNSSRKVRPVTWLAPHAAKVRSHGFAVPWGPRPLTRQPFLAHGTHARVTQRASHEETARSSVLCFIGHGVCSLASHEKTRRPEEKRLWIAQSGGTLRVFDWIPWAGRLPPPEPGPRRAGSRHTPSLPAGGDWPSGGILLMLLGFHAPAALPPCRGQSPGSEAGNASDGQEKRGIPRPRSRSTRLFHVERKPSPGHGPRTGQGQGNVPAALGADAAHEPPAIAITLPGLSSAGGSGARGWFRARGRSHEHPPRPGGLGGGRDFDDPPADVNFLWFICLFSF